MMKYFVFVMPLTLIALCFPLGPVFAAGATPTNWSKLVQDPCAKLPVDSPELTPLPDTAEAWKARRVEIMASWLNHLGPMPESVPLDPIIESEATIDGIRYILLSFATEGTDRCRAYLLLPADYTAGEKRPAAVVFHQTTLETLLEPVGLGWKQYAFAVELTRRGYVTLSPECYIMKDQGPKEEYGETWGPYTQYEKLVKRRPGWTGMGKMTFDAMRCVDYLETRREVDTQRIAACGFSLGAKEVLYALAFEPRYAVGVFMEGGIGLKMSNWRDPWYLTGFPEDKVGEREHHEILALIAPKPFLIIGADEGTGKNTNAADGAPSWPFVKAALPVYKAVGARDRLGLYVNGLNEHNMDNYSKEMAYNWIDEWLNVGHPENFYTPTVSCVEIDQSKTPGKWTHTIITAKLSGRIFRGPVKIPFAVEGPAKVGVDYEIDSSPLIIPPGEDSAEITVRILNQSVFEKSDPKVVLKMGSPLGATMSTAPVRKENCTWGRRATIVTPVSEEKSTQDLRVLFIGNSQMAQYNLPQMISDLADSAPADAPRIVSERCIVGGMSLKKHWEAGDGPGTARAMIAAPEGWDYVVIQEIYAHWGNKPNPQEFEEYATRFDDAITEAGSRTIVFATASVTELTLPEYRYPDAFKALNDMQIAFARKRGIRVAAGGYTWIKHLGPRTSLEERLDLYDKDKGHPGPKGSYLYACLLYATITGRNPQGLTHEFKNIRGGISIPGDEAVEMQKVAWERYQEDKNP